MIYFDTTKSRHSRHKSGLVRVSTSLLGALGEAACPVAWREGTWVSEGRSVPFRQEDWLLTPELFSEEERPGFGRFLQSRSVRTSAIFHDALPLKLPHITWAKSVARHPSYLKMLASFERVFAVSRASATELEGYWKWLGLQNSVSVQSLQLGADLGARGAGSTVARNTDPVILQVGILEPRKNQTLTLDVAEKLWKTGFKFRLHLLGRVNPEFGNGVNARVKAMIKAGYPLRHEDSAGDARLAEAYAEAALLLFPSLGEGCGLPLLEALSHGVPCVCPDQPVFRETASGGGCLCVADGVESWAAAVGGLLSDLHARESLSQEARIRKMPTWAETAAQVLEALQGRS